MTYDYKCPDGHTYQETRGINEDQRQTTCPECDKPLARVYTAPPVQFNGNGWGSSSGRLR